MSNNKTAVPWRPGKRPGTYPEYANGCDFCANTLAYAKSGNGFAYFLTILKYANKLPKPYVYPVLIFAHVVCVRLNREDTK